MTIIPQTKSQLDRIAAKRAAYTAGLRALADILDAHPELPLPFEGTGPGCNAFSFHFLSTADPRAEMAAARRALGVAVEKNSSEADATYYRLSGKLHGLHFELSAFRKDVCERVVVATREIEVEEPDPAAVAALPKVKRTEVIEDVKWKCHPILDVEQAEPAASLS